jgi:hypothetical protein
MGLFSTFPKKPAVSGSAPHPSSGGSLDTHGKISRLEIKNVHRDLINRFGRTKGERIYSTLQPNMDKDRGFGTSGISAKEANEALENMSKNPYDGIDKHDTEKLKDILEKRM